MIREYGKQRSLDQKRKDARAAAANLPMPNHFTDAQLREMMQRRGWRVVRVKNRTVMNGSGQPFSVPGWRVFDAAGQWKSDGKTARAAVYHALRRDMR